MNPAIKPMAAMPATTQHEKLPRIDYLDTDFAPFAAVKELIRVLTIIRGSHVNGISRGV